MQPPPDETTLVGPSTEKVAETFREAGEAFNPAMGIHTARMMYDYCAGLSWPASEAKHVAALRRQLGLTAPPTTIPDARRGRVRMSGRAMVDDAGPWLAFGASYFPILPLVRDEFGRAAANLLWLATRHIDFIRAFTDVSGPTWADRRIEIDDPDWPSLMRQAVGVVEECHLRVWWTLFAGPREQHDPAWYRAATHKVVDQLEMVLDTVQGFEIRNEGEGPDDQTARQCAEIIRRRLPDVPVALCGTPEKLLPAIYQGSLANIATVHWDRTYAERGWRPVRQPWGYYELHDMPTPHLNNEPIGIDSSVSEHVENGVTIQGEHDPLKIAAAAITAWVTGECAYTLHHGAGIRAGGAADLARTPPRQPDCWMQPALEPALALITSARAMLPPDLVSWQRAGHAWPEHPLSLETLVGDAVEAGADGCNRCYAMTRGNQAVVFVAGIRNRFVATSKGGPFAVLRPMNNAWTTTNITSTFDLREDFGSCALLIR